MPSTPLTLFMVHAHPDDETIGTGGTLARYASEGVRTVLVCCTRGEEGEIHDATLDADDARPRLGQIREKELRRAAAALGVGVLHFLPYRDSGMAGSPAAARPDSFAVASIDDASRRVAALIREERPLVVVAYDPGGGYGHPDHVKAHQVAVRAIARAAQGDDGRDGWTVQKLYYPAIALSALREANAAMKARGLPAPFNEDDQRFDARQKALPDAALTARIAVGPYRDQVVAALRAYRTQLDDDDVLLSLPPDIASHAFAVESYVRVWTRVDAPPYEDDLFAGLRET